MVTSSESPELISIENIEEVKSRKAGNKNIIRINLPEEDENAEFLEEDDKFNFREISEIADEIDED